VILNDILQPTHLLLILVVALLVLGPKRLPEATRSIGRGIHDFKSAVTGDSQRGDSLSPDATAGESGERTV
jgi:sec-independent protein translocase protein TatA